MQCHRFLRTTTPSQFGRRIWHPSHPTGIASLSSKLDMSRRSFNSSPADEEHDRELELSYSRTDLVSFSNSSSHQV